MSFELKGKVYIIGETQVKSDKFKNREFVITYADNPSYPEFRKLEVIQDKVSLLDSIKVGQEVTCHVNPKGRKWTDANGVDKFFNADQAWKIDVIDPIYDSPVEPIDEPTF